MTDASPSRGDVAVIIPAYNSGAYLDQALASVAGQTQPAAMVVVADDCSSDDTAERARRWQDRLPLVVVKLDRNRGPGMARHEAILAAKAPLLAMLDADDYFLPDHLETMAAAHTARPGLVSAQEFAWSPGAVIRPPDPTWQPPQPPHQLAALIRFNFINFGFFSRELYDRAGGFRELYCEDWDLWIRMLRAGAAVTFTSHPTAVHRVHPSSRSYNRARTVERSMSILNELVAGAHSPAEVTAARAGLRVLRGKQCFYRASDLAAEGQFRQARRAALAGLPAGSLRAAAGLMALAVAPGAAARLERRTRTRRSPADVAY